MDKLGRRLKVGECFESTSKKMTLIVRWRDIDDDKKSLIHRKKGTKDFFQHKGRRYYCEVIGTVETRTGWYHGVWLYPERKAELDKHVKWWQFVYLLQIIEN
jgi:hypothetical protein